MTDAVAVPQIEQALDGQRVGPAMWGDVYRCHRSGTYVRIIPSGTPGLTLRRRTELDGWSGLPATEGVAPVVQVDQRRLAGSFFHCVEYKIQGEPLAGLITGGDPVERVSIAAAVLRALPDWWASLAPGLLVTPGDVVVVDGTPHLLRVPHWGVPPASELLAQPRRVLHLAPELVRGTCVAPRHAADLFSLGATVLGCAFDLDGSDAATVLQRMASGTALDARHRRDRLPGWSAALPAVSSAFDRADRLVAADPDVRLQTDLDALAEDLLACAVALDPVESVGRLRADGDAWAALRLAQDALLDNESYDLYLVAADLAAIDLRQPRIALTFLDEAVRVTPERPEAYARQFALIGRQHRVIIAAPPRLDESFADRLDRIMTTALDHFGADERDEMLPMMARYLNARRQGRRARRLLHPALTADGQQLWWKFWHMIEYGRAYVSDGDRPSAAAMEAAERVAGMVRHGLDKVRRNKTMPDEAIGVYGEMLRDLEEELRRLRQDDDPPPAGVGQ